MAEGVTQKGPPRWRYHLHQEKVTVAATIMFLLPKSCQVLFWGEGGNLLPFPLKEALPP